MAEELDLEKINQTFSRNPSLWIILSLVPWIHCGRRLEELRNMSNGDRIARRPGYVIWYEPD